MVYDILVTQDAQQRYTARVLSLPDIVVSGNDERDVLQQVQTAITHLHRNSHIVHLSIPMQTDKEADPWRRAAGMWAEDPDWEQFQQAIQSYRQQMDTPTDLPQ